jgi:hypothetical protein
MEDRMTKQEVNQMSENAQGAMPVHKNVYTALVAAQAEMGPLIKGAVNPHFKSKYADLADLVTAVRGPLTRNGLVFFHQIVTDGDERMRTTLMHGESETCIECDVRLIVAKNDMQGMKSATTYAKRIGLESVTGVAPEDDDGNAAASSPPPVPSEDAILSAATSLLRAESVDQLRAIWGGLPRQVQMNARCVTAKENRKGELTKTPPVAVEIDDEIPEVV